MESRDCLKMGVAFWRVLGGFQGKPTVNHPFFGLALFETTLMGTSKFVVSLHVLLNQPKGVPFKHRRNLDLDGNGQNKRTSNKHAHTSTHTQDISALLSPNLGRPAAFRWSQEENLGIFRAEMEPVADKLQAGGWCGVRWPSDRRIPQDWFILMVHVDGQGAKSKNSCAAREPI